MQLGTNDRSTRRARATLRGSSGTLGTHGVDDHSALDRHLCGRRPMTTSGTTERRRRSVLPPGATSDAALLLQTRGIRALGDGLVSVVLAAYLTSVGLGELRIGI